jgi:hypothetical protein
LMFPGSERVKKVCFTPAGRGSPGFQIYPEVLVLELSRPYDSVSLRALHCGPQKSGTLFQPKTPGVLRPEFIHVTMLRSPSYLVDFEVGRSFRDPRISSLPSHSPGPSTHDPQRAKCQPSRICLARWHLEFGTCQDANLI